MRRNNSFVKQYSLQFENYVIIKQQLASEVLLMLPT